MSDKIFLLKDDDELLEMVETAYDSEALLQQLLEDYPALLAGDQIDPAEPKRLLLIRREMTVPDSESSAGRWALDHLFVDQDGVPTLVEVKRSTDSRIRREVVAQMLDYAANSVQYWNIEDIVTTFIHTCAERGSDPDGTLAAFLPASITPDEYWETVLANLRRGKIRLLFVADTIPPELKRIIEFLNEQMNPAEVLGVEVKQYRRSEDEGSRPPSCRADHASGRHKACPLRKAASVGSGVVPWAGDGEGRRCIGTGCGYNSQRGRFERLVGAIWKGCESGDDKSWV